MTDSKDYLASTGSPYTVILGEKTFTFPKLILENISVLASKCKAIQVKNLKALIEEEKPESRARFMALTVSRDFSLNDVWEWATTIDGGIEVVKLSLVQSGQDANIVNELDAEELFNVATEVTGHWNAPSKVAKRLLEEEKKKKDDGEEEKK